MLQDLGASAHLCQHSSPPHTFPRGVHVSQFWHYLLLQIGTGKEYLVANTGALKRGSA